MKMRFFAKSWTSTSIIGRNTKRHFSQGCFGKLNNPQICRILPCLTAKKSMEEFCKSASLFNCSASTLWKTVFTFEYYVQIFLKVLLHIKNIYRIFWNVSRGFRKATPYGCSWKLRLSRTSVRYVHSDFFKDFTLYKKYHSNNIQCAFLSFNWIPYRLINNRYFLYREFGF